MPKIAIATGLALIALGIGAYLATQTSFTAMIPALFGLPIFAFGLVARDEFKRKHAMHGAVLFGLLGLLGSVGMGMRKWPLLIQGAPVERPVAAWSQLIMAIICGVFVALCVRSFIAARRSREDGA